MASNLLNFLNDNPKLAWASIPKGTPRGGRFGGTSATVNITESCPLEMVVDSFRDSGYRDEEIYLG